VWVRARVEEEIHEILVPVDNRNQQSSCPIRSGGVDVSARRRQHADGFDTTSSNREQQGGQATVGASLELCVGINQHLHDLRVSCFGGPHQRGLTVPGFVCVNGGSIGQQQPHGFYVSGTSRQHQRSLSAPHRGIGIGAGFQQRFNDLGIPIAAGQ